MIISNLNPYRGFPAFADDGSGDVVGVQNTFLLDTFTSQEAQRLAIHTGEIGATWTQNDTDVAYVVNGGYLSLGVNGPAFADVSFLLHFDGTNGTNNFVDSGPIGRTMDFQGGAIHSIGAQRFGPTSLRLQGGFQAALVQPGVTGNPVPPTTDPFTYEGWALTSSVSVVKVLVSWLNAGIGLNVEVSATGALGLRLVGPGLYAEGGSIPIGSWFYYAVTRDGSTFRLFLNGTLVATLTSTISFGASTLFIGALNGDTTKTWVGYIDEVRMTTYSLYDASFVPPSTAFPDY